MNLDSLLANNPKFALEQLDTLAAAAELGVSPRTLETWRTLPNFGPRFVKVGGKKVRYRRIDLLDFSQANCVRSTGEYVERRTKAKRAARRKVAA